MKQVKRVELLHSTGQDVSFAKEILETLHWCQMMHLRHRDLLLTEIQRADISAELLEKSRLAIAESKRLLA
jgi:hypothetical protein